MTEATAASHESLTIPQLFDLSGQTAIVTGAALGIGQGIACRLAEAGAGVVIADVNMDAATATAGQMTRRGNRAVAVQADVSAVADAQRVVQAAVDNFGRLDILVNNAGIFPFLPALDIDEAHWDRIVDINLKGAFFFAQAAARQMIAQGQGGKIVNIASIDAVHPTSGGRVPYDAAKAGIVAMTKALAVEWGNYGIAVNAIAPGGISTPGGAAEGARMAQMGAASAEAATSFMARIPLKRMGEPDDIATVALFLVSKASGYMTGGLVVVDGGYLLS